MNEKNTAVSGYPNFHKNYYDLNKICSFEIYAFNINFK